MRCVIRTLSCVSLIFIGLLTSLPVFAQVINGCVHSKSGSLRIVDDPGDCRRTEVSISWSLVTNEGVMSAHIGFAGEVISQRGEWIATSERQGFNLYILSFFPETFSGTPHCVITPFNDLDPISETVTANIESASQSELKVRTYIDNFNSVENTPAPFFVFCQNPE